MIGESCLVIYAACMPAFDVYAHLRISADNTDMVVVAVVTAGVMTAGD